MKRYMIGTAAVLCSALLAGAAFAGDLKMNGSTTVLPIAQAAAEKFMASHGDVKITVSGGGSGNGIKALIDGTTDVAMASRPMKDKEKSDAEAKGVKPVEIKIAIDAICAMVHPSNPVSDLSMEQLQEIYTGKVEKWKAVGGEDKAIAVAGRDTSSGTFGTWEEMVMHGEKVTPKALVTASSGALLQTVAKNPLAIGYDGIAYINNTVKALKVNGVEANAANAKSGAYPLSRFLFLYTNGEPQGDAKAFVDYLLSPEGQKIVEKVGYIPLN